MSDSDSDEFFDADEELSKPTRKTSKQSASEAEVGGDSFDDELERLKEEQRKAEERRRREDEAMQERLRELERKKREREEQERKRLEEERIQREKERAEQERREKEEERRRKEQQEAIERRQEAERRRKRLESLRDNDEEGEGGVEEAPETTSTEQDPEKETTEAIPSQGETEQEVEVVHPEPPARSSPEPDVVAMTKTKPPQPEDPMPAPPVAPPRRKKKKKPQSEGLKKPDTLSIDTMSVISVPSVQGDDVSMNSEVISIGTGLPSENEPKDVLTPTTTIESITKELEHSLDLASAVHGGGVVLHMDTQSIKGDSKIQVERARAEKFDEKQRKNTPDAETLMLYDNLMKEGRTAQGTQLTDEEVLALVMVKNLDTGEKVSLLKAEEHLPQCVNPLALHIMRLTSEYVSNSSLDKVLSDEESRDSVKIPPDLKKKGKKLKSFLSKTASKIKHKADEQLHKEKEEELSDEELLPDTISLKFKASSSNKGPHDFDQLKVAQDMSGEHTGAIWTMKFSPCGRLLATGGQDHLLRVWVLKDHFTYFDDMRIKYSNQQLVSSEEPSSEGDKQTPESGNDDAPAPPSEADVSQAEGSAPLSPANNELEVFAPSPFCTYTGHTADLLDISWSKNYFLLSSSMDKMVRLWHISRTECLCCFQHIDFVTAIAFHPKDDRYFLSGSLDGKLRLWNIPDKRVALWNEVDGPTKLITAANFIQNGRFAVIGTYDGRCIFYDTEHLKYYTQIHVRSTRGRNAKGRKITAIEPLPGQDKILVTSNDSRIRLYDLRDLSLACKYKGALNLSSQIRASFSHTYKYIISGSEDHSVYIWKTSYDFAKFTSVRKDRNDYWESFKAHDAVVTASVFSPNPSLVLNRLEEDQEGDLVREKSEEKLDSPEDKSEKKNSLKKTQDQPEVIVSADFSGTIKVFIRKAKK